MNETRFSIKKFEKRVLSYLEGFVLQEFLNGSYYAVNTACQENDGNQVANEDTHRRTTFFHVGGASDECPQPAAQTGEGYRDEDQQRPAAIPLLTTRKRECIRGSGKAH